MIDRGGSTIETQSIVEIGATLVAFLGLATVLLGARTIVMARSARKLKLLDEVSTEVNRAVLLNEDGDQIFSIILGYALRVLDTDGLGSVLVIDENRFLTIVASRGLSDEYVRDFRIRLEDTWQYRQTGGNIADAVIVTPETILKSGYKHDEWSWTYRSVISAPVFVDGKLFGMINIDSRRKGTFGPDDLEVMRRFQAQLEVCLLARERYRTRLAHSQLDGLTRFLNRVPFEERLAQAIAHAQRHGETFTLGMFDVDKLKVVNDLHGHAAGDTLLRTVTDALRATARKSDLLGRFGGDEFVAVFLNTNGQTMAERTNQTLQALKAAPIDLGQAWVTASFSYGFVEFPADGRTSEELVAEADRRLYLMKSQRRNEQPGESTKNHS